MLALKVMEQTVQDAPDQQVSLTDPDLRSMATSGKGTGSHAKLPPPSDEAVGTYIDSSAPGLCAPLRHDLNEGIT
jgi:hypothetical protein